MTQLSPRAIERSTTILGALHRNKDGLTLHELGAATGMDHTTLYNELQDMMLRKQVAREPLGGNVHALQAKTGAYRYTFTPEFGKLVVDLG